MIDFEDKLTHEYRMVCLSQEAMTDNFRKCPLGKRKNLIDLGKLIVLSHLTENEVLEEKNYEIRKIH